MRQRFEQRRQHGNLIECDKYVTPLLPLFRLNTVLQRKGFDLSDLLPPPTFSFFCSVSSPGGLQFSLSLIVFWLAGPPKFLPDLLLQTRPILSHRDVKSLVSALVHWHLYPLRTTCLYRSSGSAFSPCQASRQQWPGHRSHCYHNAGVSHRT